MQTKEKRIKKQKRIRGKIRGTVKRPRLSVHKSARFVYAQLIDDEKGVTILGVSERHLSSKDKTTKIERAKEIGLLVAKQAKDKKITTVIFDRGSYPYHGRVKAIADGAREGGLKF